MNGKLENKVSLQLAGIYCGIELYCDIVILNGQYHKDCKRDFFLRFKDRTKSEKTSYIILVGCVNCKGNRNQIWNSSGLSYVYTENQSSSSDVQKDSWTLMKHLSNYFNGSLVLIHAWNNAKCKIVLF